MLETVDEWREASAEEARKRPESYLSGYPDIVFSDDEVMMTRRDYFRLDVYDCSMPTGVYREKCWRRYDTLCFYGDDSNDRVPIRQFTIQIIGERDCEDCDGNGWLMAHEAEPPMPVICPTCERTGRIPVDHRLPKKECPLAWVP